MQPAGALNLGDADDRGLVQPAAVRAVRSRSRPSSRPFVAMNDKERSLPASSRIFTSRY
jgi:hypothetical protein